METVSALKSYRSLLTQFLPSYIDKTMELKKTRQKTRAGLLSIGSVFGTLCNQIDTSNGNCNSGVQDASSHLGIGECNISADNGGIQLCLLLIIS